MKAALLLTKIIVTASHRRKSLTSRSGMASHRYRLSRNREKKVAVFEFDRCLNIAANHFQILQRYGDFLNLIARPRDFTRSGDETLG